MSVCKKTPSLLYHGLNTTVTFIECIYFLINKAKFKTRRRSIKFGTVNVCREEEKKVCRKIKKEKK